MKTKSDQATASTPDRRATVSDGQTVYPITRLQKEILFGLDHPETTKLWEQRWYLESATRIVPGLDVTRAKRAFEKIASRHDALRMRFRRTGQGWNAIIDKMHPTGAVVHDLGPVSDGELTERIDAAVLEDFDLEAGPLAQLIIYRCGNKGDVLLFRQHHLTSDGWSMMVLADEFVKAYLGLPFWGQKPPGLGEYLKHFDRLPPDQEQEADRYWEQLLLPPVAPPRIGCAARGNKPKLGLLHTRPAGSVEVELNGKGTGHMQAVTREAKSTQLVCLLSAYAMALCEFGKVDEVYICTNAARTEARLSRYVGLVVYTLPLRCSVSKHPTHLELSGALSAQLRTSLQYVRSDACLVRERFDELVEREGGNLRQFGCAVPEPDVILKDSVIPSASETKITKIGSLQLEPLPISMPSTVTAELILTTSMDAGSLSFVLRYDPQGFDEEQVCGIAKRILQILRLSERHVASFNRYAVLEEEAG